MKTCSVPPGLRRVLVVSWRRVLNTTGMLFQYGAGGLLQEPAVMRLTALDVFQQLS